MLLPDSKQKEYEQNAHTPFVYRQVKPALWKAPILPPLFLCFAKYTRLCFRFFVRTAIDKRARV